MIEWTEVLCDELKAMWHEGLSTRVIGQQLGCSKNSVIGKAQRLGLPKRPRCIVRGRKKKKKRNGIVAPPPRRAEFSVWAPRTCQFIEGSPSADDSCKCGKSVYETEDGRSSYCEEHHAICWVRHYTGSKFVPKQWG